MTEYAALDEGSGGERDRTATGDDDTRKSLTQMRPFSKAAASGLSEPLNSSAVEEGGGGRTVDPGDPFYVFSDDLKRKLELVDEALAEFLRVVHQTVRINPKCLQ